MNGLRLLTALCLVLFLFPCNAPGQELVDYNLDAWFMYFGDHPFGGSRWGAHLEAQVRRSEGVAIWQQLLLRPGVNYKLSANLLLTGGWAFIDSYPYGDYPSVSRRTPEHRFYEQLIYRQKAGRVAIQHRLRLEQRLVGQFASGSDEVTSWQYRNRFRYFLRGDIPFSTSPANRFGLALYDEVFLGFGQNHGPRVLDQNRAYAALTYKLTPKNRVEVGYLHQYIPQRNGRVFEHNHTLQFAWFSTTPFGFGK